MNPIPDFLKDFLADPENRKNNPELDPDAGLELRTEVEERLQHPQKPISSRAMKRKLGIETGKTVSARPRRKTKPSLRVSEGQIKKAVADFLEIKQKQGELMYLRLNSGSLIEARGETRRRIQLCPPGTADFVLIRQCYVEDQDGEPIGIYVPEVTFLELKAQKGSQSPDQVAFQERVEDQLCRYAIIRDVSELEELLK